MKAAAERHRPRKQFGQHFLIAEDVIDQILALVSPCAGETIIEIGPGQGALTDRLAESGARIVAVEIDTDLVSRLQARYEDNPLVKIVSADVLKVDLGALTDRKKAVKLVGNLPYNISTPLLLKLVDTELLWHSITVMVQAEVGERLAAFPGSKAYGRLSVMAQLGSEIFHRFPVTPSAFRPPPKVQSAVLQLYPLAREISRDQRRSFEQIVLRAFNQRRKTLANALRSLFSAAELSEAAIDPTQRAENISIDEYLTLAQRLSERS